MRQPMTRAVSGAGTSADRRPATAEVELRPLPLGYRAMMAIASDLDETPDRRVYRDIARFLNTTEAIGTMGEGVGLEVGNTIYFDMPPDQFAYWNTDDAGRAMVRAMIRSGHVDCLHSYGDLATTGAHAGRALDELARHDLRVAVWIDHAVAPTNLGADIMRGEGDLPGSPAYHADLTLGHGVRYVWRGRVTSVIGQDVPRRLGGIARLGRPLSARTVAKEAAKGLLGRALGGKYAMHAANATLRPVTLRDGRRAIEFLRANPYWGGVEHAATAGGLAEVLTREMLERLVERGGTQVLYTHLGKVASPEEPFGRATRGALRRLAAEARAGRILVATTRRVLDYRRMLAGVSFSAAREGAWLRIDASSVAPALAGLTFEVPDPARTRLFVDGREVPRIVRSGPDPAGRGRVSVPWPKLELPRP